MSSGFVHTDMNLDQQLARSELIPLILSNPHPHTDEFWLLRSCLRFEPKAIMDLYPAWSVAFFEHELETGNLRGISILGEFCYDVKAHSYVRCFRPLYATLAHQFNYTSDFDIFQTQLSTIIVLLLHLDGPEIVRHVISSDKREQLIGPSGFLSSEACLIYLYTLFFLDDEHSLQVRSFESITKLDRIMAFESLAIIFRNSSECIAAALTKRTDVLRVLFLVLAN
jgi:hypothetical protein